MGCGCGGPKRAAIQPATRDGRQQRVQPVKKDGGPQDRKGGYYFTGPTTTAKP